jgi:hypothetical protein
MSPIVAAAICLGAWIATAAIARGPAAAHAGFALPVMLLPLPWFVDASAEARIVLAFAVGILFISAADFAAGRRPPTFVGRLTYIVAFAALIDLTTRERVARHFDRRAAGRILLAVGAVGLGIALWTSASEAPRAMRTVIRVIAAAGVILAVADAHSDVVRLVSGLFGVRFADVHDHPYRSTTLADFWSRRWDRVAARWFRQHAFLPARKAGLTAALFSLFAVSAVMHAYLVAAVVSMPWMVAAFFLVQPLLLMAERAMRVRRWRPLPARLWTIATLTTLLPLLLIPLGFAL